jgi:hypothetical protein
MILGFFSYINVKEITESSGISVEKYLSSLIEEILPRLNKKFDFISLGNAKRLLRVHNISIYSAKHIEIMNVFFSNLIIDIKSGKSQYTDLFKDFMKRQKINDLFVDDLVYIVHKYHESLINKIFLFYYRIIFIVVILFLLINILYNKNYFSYDIDIGRIKKLYGNAGGFLRLLILIFCCLIISFLLPNVMYYFFSNYLNNSYDGNIRLNNSSYYNSCYFYKDYLCGYYKYRYILEDGKQDIRDYYEGDLSFLVPSANNTYIVIILILFLILFSKQHCLDTFNLIKCVKAN